MAENDINSQEILNRLLQNTNQAESEHLNILRNIGAELKMLLGTQRARTEGEKALLSLSTRMQESAKQNLEYLARTSTLNKQIEKDTKLILEAETERDTIAGKLNKKQQKYLETIQNNASKVSEAEKSIFELRKRYDESLNSRERGNLSRQIKTAEKRLSLSKTEYLQAISFQRTSAKQRKLEEELADKILEKQKASTARYSASDSLRTQAIVDEARLMGEISQIRDKIRAERSKMDVPDNAKQDILKIVHLNQMASQMKLIKEEREAALDIEKQIEQRMGMSGTLLKGMSGTMKLLGADSSVVGSALKEAQERMKEMATEAQAGETSGELSRMNILAAGTKVLFSKIVEQAFSLESILAFLGKAILQADDNTVSFQKVLGVSRGTAHSLNMEMEKLAWTTGDAFINSNRLRKSFFELTKELGYSAAGLGGEMLISMTNFTERLGMSANEAASLSNLLRLNGKNTEAQADAIGDQVTALNKQNKTMFSMSVISKEIANTSKAIVLNFQKNPKALVEAVYQANKLGMSLSQLDKISESLIDFESSISSELEARLLTGNMVNLARARELSLTGELGQLGQELNRQEAVREAFRTKNVIAQKSIAAAIGMSREELAQMLMKQDMIALSAESFKKEWGEASYEQQKSLSISERFAAIVEKIKTLAVGIVSIFEPIINGINWILSIKFLPQFLTGVVVLTAMLKLIGKLNIATGLLAKIRPAAGSLWTRMTGRTPATPPVTPPTQPTGRAGNRGTSFLQGLSRVNWKTLAGGAVVMVAFAASMFIFSKAMKELEGIPLDRILWTLGGFTASIVAITAVMSLLASGPGWIAVGMLGAFALAFLGFGAAIKLAGEGLSSASDGFSKVVQSIKTLGMSDISTVLTMAQALDTLANSVENINRKGPISLFSPKTETTITGKTSQTVAQNTTPQKTPTEQISNAKIVAKLDELIAAVKKGGNVYMDSNKVGIALAMGTYKQG